MKSNKILILKTVLNMFENNKSTKEISEAISKLKPEDIKVDIFGHKTKTSEFRLDIVNDKNIWCFNLSFEENFLKGN